MGFFEVLIVDKERDALLSSPGLFMSRVPRSLRPFLPTSASFSFSPATTIAAEPAYAWRYWSASEEAFAMA